MSFDVRQSEPTGSPLQDTSELSPKHSYKSYKKKYNKMRHNFKEKMRISNVLFDEDQKATKLARRLREQNDQLLDLLLDVNECTRIPPHLRYDTRSPTPSETAVPALEPDVVSRTHSAAWAKRAVLEEARMELSTGQISPKTYTGFENSLLARIPLSRLEQIPHTNMSVLSENQVPAHVTDPQTAGYLSLDHEEEYLSALDATLEGLAQPVPESHPIRSNEREKDAALRNPVSVYNWLRKHQPQVFLQDSDSSPDKASTKPSSTAKQTKKSIATAKPEPDAVDEEGYPIATSLEGASKSKRKREDEPYRPKGGSSRPTKKKRTSGGQVEKKPAGDEEGY